MATSAPATDEPTAGFLPNAEPEKDLSRPTLSDTDMAAIDKGLDDAGVRDLTEAEQEAEKARKGGKPTPPPEVAPTGPTAPPEPAKPAPAPTDAPAPTGPTEPPGATGAPTGSPTPTGAPAPEPDREIDAIVEPRGLNPTNRENWKKLQQTARDYKAKLLTSEAALVASQKVIMEAQGKLPEAVTKELEDLRQFRRIWDIQRDPEFQTKFETAIEANETDIYAMLKQNGMKDDVIEGIKKAESKPMGVKGARALPMSWWEKEVLQPLAASSSAEENASAILMRRKLEENTTLSYEKKKAVEAASVNQSDWQKQREETTKKQHEETVGIVRGRVEQAIKDLGWKGVQEIPKDATPEVKAQMEQENQFARETEERLKVALNPQNPLQRAETAIAACIAFMQDKELVKQAASIKERDETIKARDEEIAKLKTAKQTKGGAAAPIVPNKTSLSSRLLMKDEAAIEAGLAEAGA